MNPRFVNTQHQIKELERQIRTWKAAYQACREELNACRQKSGRSLTEIY